MLILLASVALSHDGAVRGGGEPSATRPTHSDLMLPLLKAVKDGKAHKIRDASERAFEILGLSHDARAEIMPGRTTTYVKYRAGWANYRLKQARLLEAPERGLVKITQMGLDVLKEGPARIDRKYLAKFESDENTEMLDQREISLETPDEIMRRGLKGMKGKIYQELKEELVKMSPDAFERLVLDLCNKMGYGKPERLGKPGDQGIDGTIWEDRLGLGEIHIQAKRWEPDVGPAAVRDFIGALSATGTKKGIFITTSSFTAGARDAVENLKDGTRVKLIDGNRLVELMDEYGVGVVRAEDIAINRVDGEYFTQFD